MFLNTATFLQGWENKIQVSQSTWRTAAFSNLVESISSQLMPGEDKNLSTVLPECIYGCLVTPIASKTIQQKNGKGRQEIPVCSKM